MSGMLPDREKRHLLQFHLLPRLSYGPRVAAAAAVIAVGILLQAAIYGGSPETAIWVGAPVLLAGTALLLLKGYDLSPKAAGEGGDWERTTLDRFREVLDLERQVNRWDRTMVDISCGPGCLSLLAFVVAPVALLYVALAQEPEDEWLALLAAVDAAVLVLPHWLTGIRRKWRPIALRERVDVLLAALEEIAETRGPEVKVQPMFLMRGEGAGRVPVDARAFLRFPAAPEDFLGLQFQVSINAVQGTNYPYLYAVLVAKKSFGLPRHVAGVERIASGLTVEESAETDADVIVIRQTTTKKSGYHTNSKAAARLAGDGYRSAEMILSAVASGTG